jgi:hypothetical protein
MVIAIVIAIAIAIPMTIADKAGQRGLVRHLVSSRITRVPNAAPADLNNQKTTDTLV